MHYQVTAEEQYVAKNPHHIFNLNILLVHLALSKVSLELGGGEPLFFILVPFISILVLSYIYFHGKTLAKTKSWFVAAHWQLAWRRGRILIMAYIAAIIVMLISHLIGLVTGGGLMMNDLSLDGGSTPIHEKITMFLAAVLVFVAVLITFFQTGISVYDAGKGIIDPKISQYLPRDENSNPELGKGDDEVSPETAKTVKTIEKIEKND